MICIVLSYGFPHAFFTCHGPILEAGLHFWMEVWVELSCHGSFMDGCAMYRAASCHLRECRRICWRSNTALYLLAGRTLLAKDGGGVKRIERIKHQHFDKFHNRSRKRTEHFSIVLRLPSNYPTCMNSLYDGLDLNTHLYILVA